MTQFLPRSAWTSTGSSSNGKWNRRPDGMVAHWPAAREAIGRASAERIAILIRGWRNYHVRNRGWGDLGYNFVIDQEGRVWEGRGFGNVGSHCAAGGRLKDANTRNLGVVFAVGPGESLTPEAIAAWHDLRDEWLRRYPAATRVTGHGLLTGTTECPGSWVRGVLPDLAHRGAFPVGNPLPGLPTPVPPPVQAPGGRNYLALGDYNDSRVRNLQAGLRRTFPAYRWRVRVRRGTLLTADGDFGPQTDAWVREFQRRSGLVPDGLVGPRTQAALARHGIRL